MEEEKEAEVELKKKTGMMTHIGGREGKGRSLEFAKMQIVGTHLQLVETVDGVKAATAVKAMLSHRRLAETNY